LRKCASGTTGKDRVEWPAGGDQGEKEAIPGRAGFGLTQTLYPEAQAVAKTKKTRQAAAKDGKAKARPAKEPSHYDLVREADVTATATVRFAGQVFVRVTHPEYMPHEVMALVRRGQVQLDPVAPGQVGTLILDGFPYTVLGYYTFAEQDAEYERAPDGWSFHGPFYDFYRDQAAMIQGLVNASGEDFDEVRQMTRDLRDNMDKAARPKRRQQRPKARKS
jgi:hypothetical protein